MIIQETSLLTGKYDTYYSIGEHGNVKFICLSTHFPLARSVIKMFIVCL